MESTLEDVALDFNMRQQGFTGWYGLPYLNALK